MTKIWTYIIGLFKGAKVYFILGSIIAILIGLVWLQMSRIQEIKSDRDIYKNNTESLLKDIETYKTKDSLNAATVGELKLELSDFKEFRENDAKLIESLQIKNRDLKAVTTAQSQTIIRLRGTVRDSIIYRDNVIVDTLYCLDIMGKWFDLHGCANGEHEFTGTFQNRDSLLIAETVKYKRFLWILWKTSKIKDRKIDVVSKNPDTKILGVEFTTIRD